LFPRAITNQQGQKQTLTIVLMEEEIWFEKTHLWKI